MASCCVRRKRAPTKSALEIMVEEWEVVCWGGCGMCVARVGERVCDAYALLCRLRLAMVLMRTHIGGRMTFPGTAV